LPASTNNDPERVQPGLQQAVPQHTVALADPQHQAGVPGQDADGEQRWRSAHLGVGTSPLQLVHGAEQQAAGRQAVVDGGDTKR
jgi:hypothetical protein